MPLMTKSADFKKDGDGYYHLQFGLSATIKDLQNDTMNENALNGMVKELETVPIAINNSHDHSIINLIGPTTKAWVDGTDMIVDLRVRKMWEDHIKDLVDSETPLGGSIEGKATKMVNGQIDQVKLVGGGLTDIPAAWNLRGSAKQSTCPGDVCSQMRKTLDDTSMLIKWDGSASNYTDEQYKSATLWCDPKVASGDMSVKSGCKLPVKTPDGKLDAGGVQVAYAAMQGARNTPNIPDSAKAGIMSKLTGYYKQLGLTGKGPLKKDIQDDAEDKIIERFIQVLDEGIEAIKDL